MLKIKFDIRLMKYISLFENVTHSEAKDCIEGENSITFVVNEGQIGKAIGKEGSNVHKLENMLKKKIRIIEYNHDLKRFIENVIYPNKAKSVVEEEGIVTIESMDSKSRGFLIGRNASILRNNENIVKRYFEIQEIKVI